MGLVEKYGSENIILTNADRVIHWAQKSSLWPLTFGLACCAIEMMSAYAPHYDLNRFGVLPFPASPRQADLMIVCGTITRKMGPAVLLLYQQMSDPKWVIAMGSCAIGGGPFADAYNTVRGAEEIIPVDVFIPGCPPRPEQLIHGILKLQDLVAGKVAPAALAR
jgi:NADH-quinone oxidoreductase subunit B